MSMLKGLFLMGLGAGAALTVEHTVCKSENRKAFKNALSKGRKHAGTEMSKEQKAQLVREVLVERCDDTIERLKGEIAKQEEKKAEYQKAMAQPKAEAAQA